MPLPTDTVLLVCVHETGQRKQGVERYAAATRKLGDRGGGSLRIECLVFQDQAKVRGI
jgi:hypothetical protein